MQLKKIINYFRKSKFVKEFKSFDRSSGIGSDGFAEKCHIIGKKNITIGKDTFIGDGTEIIAIDSHLGTLLNPNLVFGNNVRVTARLRLTCANHIEIGDNVLIAPDVFITDHSHGMDPEYPGGYSPQPLILGTVKIGNGVWIGQRASVLKDVSIGTHSIIGAQSVVTHDIPAYCIAVGTPARVIKKYNLETKKWERV